jgi:hypothetical protein
MNLALLLINYVLISFAMTYVLWIFYLAVMSLAHAKRDGTLTKTARFLGTPILVVGLFIDLIVNVFVMTPLLLELPREMTVTSRLKRHNRGPDSWRKKFAQWFEPILDPYDPKGDHI